MVHVSDLSLQYCVGCGSCYKTGACIYKDDIENLSLSVADADGIIIGSPTYASNVSGQMKVIIDRGHFVMEQVVIMDNGSGMSIEILKKYFLNVGVSYYASDDYLLQGRNYSPMYDL